MVRSHFQLLMKILTPSQSASTLFGSRRIDKLMLRVLRGIHLLPEGPGSVCENVANGENLAPIITMQVMRKSAGSVTFADLLS